MKKKSAQFVLFLFGMIMFQACSNHDCGCVKPPEVVPTAIQALIDGFEDCACLPSVEEYWWQNKRVFVVVFAGPACDWMPVYYDENGAIIEMPQAYSLADFVADSEFVKTVWVCDE